MNAALTAKVDVRSSQIHAANPTAKLVPVMKRRLLSRPNNGRPTKPIANAPAMPPNVLTAAIFPVPPLAEDAASTTILTASGKEAPPKTAGGSSKTA